jgi:glycosyltransferase involved in cell wall biosynthesis
VKFAFITPRYGADVSTGPDHACRLLAEHVSERHDVDVLTTCARDPRTWKNEYSEGVDRVRGALVRRFAVAQTREPVFSLPRSRTEELDWVRRNGPWAPGLIDYLKRQHRSYDALVFFCLTASPTVHGIQVAPDRSVVFPYLQLEPALRFGLFAEILSSARSVGLISAAERRLLRSYVHVAPQHEEVVGIGVDPSPEQSYPRHQQNPADSVTEVEATAPTDDEEDEPSYLSSRGVPFRRRHRLYGSFALYGGRIEPDNGSEEMLEYFDTFAGSDGGSALVLMGVKMMKVAEEPYLRMASVLPERERMIAYEAADVTIAPNADDLVAQSVLESMAVGTPVLATARNVAAVEHCRRANAGLYYANRDEFVEAMRLLMGNKGIRDRLGENGRSYVRQQFRWDAVVGRFERLVSKIRSRD